MSSSGRAPPESPAYPRHDGPFDRGHRGRRVRLVQERAAAHAGGTSALTHLDAATLPALREAFNASSAETRVLLFFSPT